MNRAERRSKARHKHEWVDKNGYGVVCVDCSERRDDPVPSCTFCDDEPPMGFSCPTCGKGSHPTAAPTVEKDSYPTGEGHG